MGTYRLILSLLVLMSHASVIWKGYNQGVAAVISFFFLSGYVMTGLIEKHYNKPSNIKFFYLDRMMRLFPQYLFYCTFAIFLVSFTPVMNPFYTVTGLQPLLLNFLMLPTGYYMYGLEKSLLLPQAWSLGLELSFYLLLPFLLIYRLSLAAFVLSLLIFTLACLEIVHTDHHGYRLLTGTLFMFLCGHFLYRKMTIKYQMILGATYLYIIALGFILYSLKKLYIPYTFEVITGFLLGFPAILALKKIALNMNINKIDGWMGNLSYGVFLNHIIILQILQYFSFNVTTLSGIILLTALSVSLSWFSFYVIERPVIQWRHFIRNKKDTLFSLSSFQPAMSAKDI